MHFRIFDVALLRSSPAIVFQVALRADRVLTPAVHEFENEEPDTFEANPFVIRLMNMPLNFESKLHWP